MESVEEVGSPVGRSQAPTTKERECSKSIPSITHHHARLNSVVRLIQGHVGASS